MDFAYLKSKRILLVDDEQALLDLVVSILQNDGYQNITTAKSVSEAVTLAKEIQQTGIAYVCTGHCTGEQAYQLLHRELGEKLHPLQVGLVMEF